MARSLFILLATLGLIAFFAGILPRITPSGLTKFDFSLMCALPIGAFFAGRHWYRYELYLLFGAAGILLFVPAYLITVPLELRYGDWPPGEAGLDAMLHDIAAWTIATVAAAVICMFTARAAHTRFPHRR